MNACMRTNVSCSSCCGLNNLNLTDQERRKYLRDNTKQFLQTDISQAENIVQFRQAGEQRLESLRIIREHYVCPFLGELSESHSGCLLHPLGSPHSQISLWEHPQNFSFYGEGICLTFDCLAKENNLNQSISATGYTRYSRLAAHYNLLKGMVRLAKNVPTVLNNLRELAMHTLEKEQAPVTGFEPAVHLPDQFDDLTVHCAKMMCREWFLGQEIPEKKMKVSHDRILQILADSVSESPNH